MKKFKWLLSVICIFSFLLSFCGCKENKEVTNIWENALYTENKELGNGEKTVMLEVKAEEKTVVFTIKTDKETLGDALTEHKLIEGEKGPFGLYVKKVNGITADYDKDKTYWSLTKNNEYVESGVDGVKIKGEEHFEFTRTEN